MWNIWDVGCSGCVMLGVWEIREALSSRCVMFTMWDFLDDGSLGLGTFMM